AELARHPERVAGPRARAEDGPIRPADRDDVDHQRPRRTGEIAAEQCGADFGGGRTEAAHHAGCERDGIVPGARERAEDPDGPCRDSGEVAQRGGRGTLAELLRLVPRAAGVAAFICAYSANRAPRISRS